MQQAGATLDMPAKRKRKASPRPKVAELKRPIASFRGTESFAAWFEGLAAHVRLPASVLIEHALVEFAASHGYKEEPPER